MVNYEGILIPKVANVHNKTKLRWMFRSACTKSDMKNSVYWVSNQGRNNFACPLSYTKLEFLL